MSHLAASQAAFFAALVPEATAQVQVKAARLLKTPPNASAEVRLDVYREMYVLRLTEVLRIDFPQVKKSLGQMAFDETARLYMVAHPPRSPSLDDVGRSFASFLQQQPSCELPRADVASLAQLEWARVLAGHCAQHTPLRFDDWLKLGPKFGPAACFTMSPSLAVLETPYAPCPLWRALERDTLCPEPQEVVSWTAVWRDGAKVSHRPLQTHEAQVLRRMLSGGNFTELCGLFVDAAAPIERVLQHMQQVFHAGLITGFVQGTL